MSPRLAVREKVLAVIDSIRGDLPCDASLEVDGEVLVKKLERFHTTRRKLFKAEKRESGKKEIEDWEKESCLEISFSKPGRKKQSPSFQEEVRKLIEKHAEQVSVDKVRVLASVIDECNQTWKKDQG